MVQRLRLHFAGDTGSIPGQGTKILRATEQLSPTTTKSMPQLEGLCATTKDPTCGN